MPNRAPDWLHQARQDLEQAKILDNFYIPTQYPDKHPEGSPLNHYGTLQSQKAVRYASAIIEFVDYEMTEAGVNLSCHLTRKS